jgi:hypothetical protein
MELQTDMILTLNGGSKLHREIARDVVEFMQQKYFDKVGNLQVEMKLSKILNRECNADGICFVLESGSRPRKFEVSIDTRLSLQDFIKTIIHEFVHVKQYVRGELVDRVRGRAKTTWNNKDHTKTPYSKQPWEREAYRLQEKFYIEYMSQGN